MFKVSSVLVLVWGLLLAGKFLGSRKQNPKFPVALGYGLCDWFVRFVLDSPHYKLVH